MQLRAKLSGRVRRGSRALVGVLSMLCFASVVQADASGQFDAYSTLFYEFGGPLSMLVVTPQANLRVDPVPEVSLRLNYEADIVSGASVAVVDAPSGDVDAITSATQLDDTRSVVSGGMEVRSRYGALFGTYAYGFESDYRSHSFNLGARTEVFDRNTTFQLSYARGFDEVCDLFQPRDQEPVQRRRLDSSEGCFGDDEKLTARELSLQTFQGSWTQAWSSIFVTQLTATGQLVDGFQSNPYRSVWLGRSTAQEHHPDNRFRYAAALGARLWIAPLGGALQARARIYRDNWDVRSVTAELAYEQSIDGTLRLRVRGRYYRQGAAAFFSDNYGVLPRGQYFTGDRELGDMESYMIGGQLAWTLTPGAEGASLGALRSFRLLIKADWLHHDFPGFHYDRAAVPNVDALVATLGFDIAF